jgi:hypothetical protein
MDPLTGPRTWKPQRAPARIGRTPSAGPRANQRWEHAAFATSISRWTWPPLGPPRRRHCCRTARHKAMLPDDDASAWVAVAGIVLASRSLALPRRLMMFSDDGTARLATGHDTIEAPRAVAVGSGDETREPASSCMHVLLLHWMGCHVCRRREARSRRRGRARKGRHARTHAPTFFL